MGKPASPAVLIALPLAKAPRQRGNTLFVDPRMEAFEDQWSYLPGLSQISRQGLEKILARIAPLSPLAPTSANRPGLDQDFALQNDDAVLDRNGSARTCRRFRHRFGFASNMSRRDTMRDPRYAGILFEIERKLHEGDRLASARGLTLTDSNIRSLLVRAVNDAKGKTAKAAEAATSDKDRLLTEALQQLESVRTAIIEERDRPDGSVERRPLPTADWVAALEAIKDSCAVHTGGEPGSRGYLEFLRGFMKDAAGAP